jgi:hypothetical protein
MLVCCLLSMILKTFFCQRTCKALLDLGQSAQALITPPLNETCSISTDALHFHNAVKLACCQKWVSKEAVTTWAEMKKKEYKTPSCPFDRNEDQFGKSLVEIGVDPTPDRPENMDMEGLGPLMLLGSLLFGRRPPGAPVLGPLAPAQGGPPMPLLNLLLGGRFLEIDFADNAADDGPSDMEIGAPRSILDFMRQLNGPEVLALPGDADNDDVESLEPLPGRRRSREEMEADDGIDLDPVIEPPSQRRRISGVQHGLIMLPSGMLHITTFSLDRPPSPDDDVDENPL